MSCTKFLRITCLLVVAAAGCSSSGPATGNGSGGSNGSGGTDSSSGGSTGSGGTTPGSGSGGSGSGSGGSTPGTGSGGSGTGSGGSDTGSGGTTPGTGSGGTTPGTGSGGTTPGTGSGGTPGTGTGSGGTTPGTGSGGSGSGTGGSAPAGDNPQLVTSASGNFWKTGTVSEVTSNADITVNDGSAQQTWEGFGGAFNEMGWNVLNSKALQDEALGLLFGNDGARFTMGRIPIGASDYAMDRYTLDETAGDTALTNFSISRDMMKLIPYVKAAQGVKSDIHFWASPWTPPTWMKSGMKSGNKPSPFDGGNMKDDDAILKALAQYFIKFVQEYDKQGIKIEAIAPQNEPNFDQNYPSALWATALYVKFIGKYMGPAFDTAGISTKIMLGTMSNGDSGKDPAIVTAVMADSAAKGYVKMVGLQWGMLEKISSFKSSLGGLSMWQTEHKCGNYPWNPSGSPAYVASAAPNDQAYGVETWNLIRDWIKAGVSSYSAWNMVLDRVGKGIDTTRDWAQNALLTVDGGKITKTPAYYVFRHFSQFVVPGAKVVSVTGSNDAIGFKNPDGSVIAVLYNSGAAKKVTVSLAGKKVQFDMPGSGWATVNYK